MIDMTMGYLYLIICSNIVDTLLCFLSLNPRWGGGTSFVGENTTSVKESRPGCFGRVHRLSKYHKVTSLSWIFGSNEQNTPLEHRLLPKIRVPVEGGSQILDPLDPNTEHP